MYARFGHGSVLGLLQRCGTAHNRVGMVNAHAAHTHEFVGIIESSLHLSRAEIVEFFRQRICIAQGFRQHFFAALEAEAVQREQVAQHAQHFPQRFAVAQRFGNAVERLQASFHADEAAGSFGERRNRQQHVRHVQQGIAFVCGKRQHAARLFQAVHGLAAAQHVRIGLDIQQQHGFFRPGDQIGNRHLVEAQHVRAHAVGRLRQNAEARA